MPPHSTREVFTSWTMKAGITAEFFDAKTGKLLEARIIDISYEAKDVSCERVTLKFEDGGSHPRSDGSATTK